MSTTAADLTHGHGHDQDRLVQRQGLPREAPED